MTEHDFSGLDHRSGRLMGPTSAVLFVAGSLLATILIVAFVGKRLSN